MCTNPLISSGPRADVQAFTRKIFSGPLFTPLACKACTRAARGPAWANGIGMHALGMSVVNTSGSAPAAASRVPIKPPLIAPCAACRRRRRSFAACACSAATSTELLRRLRRLLYYSELPSHSGRAGPRRGSRSLRWMAVDAPARTIVPGRVRTAL